MGHFDIIAEALAKGRVQLQNLPYHHFALVVGNVILDEAVLQVAFYLLPEPKEAAALQKLLPLKFGVLQRQAFAAEARSELSQQNYVVFQQIVAEHELLFLLQRRTAAVREGFVVLLKHIDFILSRLEQFELIIEIGGLDVGSAEFRSSILVRSIICAAIGFIICAAIGFIICAAVGSVICAAVGSIICAAVGSV